MQYHILDIVETQRTAGLGKPRVATILNNIGLALMELDPTIEDALPFFVEALAILIDAYGPVHVDVASVRYLAFSKAFLKVYCRYISER